MTTPDPLGVQIGAREIYDKLTDVDRKVTDTAASVQRLADQHDGLRVDVAEIRATAAEKETRLRAVERDAAARIELERAERELKAELVREATAIRTELVRDVTAIRVEMSSAKTRTISIVGAILTAAAVIVAILALVIH